MSQSAYTPLQLPFTIFGLGQTPNFVDKIEAGIPNPPNTVSCLYYLKHQALPLYEVNTCFSKTIF